jgi:hypothetical protein
MSLIDENNNEVTKLALGADRSMVQFRVMAKGVSAIPGSTASITFKI